MHGLYTDDFIAYDVGNGWLYGEWAAGQTE